MDKKIHTPIDQRTKDKVSTLYPALGMTVIDVLEAVFRKTGKLMSLKCGLRTVGEQTELYAIGRTKPGKIVTNIAPGHSPHNFALAFNICFLDEHDKELWDVFHIIAREFGLDVSTIADDPIDDLHAENLYGLEIEALYQLWKQNGLTVIFDKLDFMRKVKTGFDHQSISKLLADRIACL